MQKQVLSDINQPDTAVELSAVTKTFAQKQPARSPKEVWQGLFHPRKKIITALDAVSFIVKKGEFVAYAGPNGAGKSTTIKLLCGMLGQDSGAINVLGMAPMKKRIPLMKRVGILFGNRSELWWDHPVSTSFKWKQKVWDIAEADFKRIEALVLDLLGIGPFYNTFARELSLGQRMRCDLGMMLLHSPELILLDEPTLGLDVLAKRQMIAFLKRVNAENGTTIVVTSHDMDDLEEMARRILLLSDGALAFDGDFAALREALGCTRRAVVTMADGAQIEYPYQDTKEMLHQLSEMEGIADVSFRQTSLEEGLAALFSRWNGEKSAQA
jgi:ABC-2 type transport system ATP-binding protein